jgi:hypothetical protein
VSNRRTLARLPQLLSAGFYLTISQQALSASLSRANSKSKMIGRDFYSNFVVVEAWTSFRKIPWRI